MESIASTVRAGLEERGWQVRALEADPLAARLIVTDPADGEECEVDILKEALWRPPVQTPHGLVLSLDDVVGTKVRALADRGLARDLIDVRAAVDRWSHIELEELGRRHARESFDLAELQARLGGTDWIDDTEFAAYGLHEQEITALRWWAQEWAHDIAERLLEGEAPPRIEFGPVSVAVARPGPGACERGRRGQGPRGCGPTRRAGTPTPPRFEARATAAVARGRTSGRPRTNRTRASRGRRPAPGRAEAGCGAVPPRGRPRRGHPRCDGGGPG